MSDTTWKKTVFPNLYKREPSGTYYIRTSVNGKVVSKSLCTEDLQIARERCLRELMKLTTAREKGKAANRDMTVSDAVWLAVQEWLDDPTLREATKVSRKTQGNAAIKSWQGADKTPIRKVKQADVQQWHRAILKDYSKGYVNAMVVVIRRAFEKSMELGVIVENPAADLGFMKLESRIPELPTKDQFKEMVEMLRWQESESVRRMGEAIEFLAYGGFRWHEATLITWGDINFEAGLVHVHRETKNGKGRYVPILPQMAALLKRLKATVEASNQASIIRVKRIQRALDACSRWTGAPRMTPHTMRHLFVTACLESGVDIPTVSRWVGHQDGGLLIGKVYGHLRDEHSSTMAKRVMI